MLTKLKVLRVEFDAIIQSYEIPAFRGAINAKVGRENSGSGNSAKVTRGDTYGSNREDGTGAGRGDNARDD